jgi:hypothetical protein
VPPSAGASFLADSGCYGWRSATALSAEPVH